jgi:membrane dipeptidase
LPVTLSFVTPDISTADFAAARDLLSRFPLIDGHNDLPWALRQAGSLDPAKTDISAPVDFTHTDLPRLAKGGVGGQFWSVFVPSDLQGEAAVVTTLEQIDLVRQLVARYQDRLEVALTAQDVRRISAAGKVASLLGAEGGHSIASSLPTLRSLYQLGVRYMTLTHFLNTPWADSATDQPAHGGLTAFGREVVREMQRLGMLVDLSHVAATTMTDALDTAEGPVIFSHSSARAVCDHPRNVPDEVLARLAGNGGLCMITFVPAFVSQRCRDWSLELTAEIERRGLDAHGWLDADSWQERKEFRREWARAHPEPTATLADVVEHAEHVRDVAGVDHIGVGGDFDGVGSLPAGLEDVSRYPALIAALLDRGWSEQDCGKLACGNLLRVLADAEATAAALQAARPPSAARIDDLDGSDASDADAKDADALVASSPADSQAAG